MKRRPRTFIVLASLLLLLVGRVRAGWNHPNSCGDEELAHVSSQPSVHPTALLSTSSPVAGPDLQSSPSFSSSGGGSFSKCNCSFKPTAVSASAGTADGGSGSFVTSIGTTIDIAQQLYIRYQAGDEIDQIKLETVPGMVRGRLENLSVTFEDLPGLIQRAVLWDSGFAVTSDYRAVQVWTLDNRTMADVAMSVDEFEAAGCEALSCTPSNGSVVETYSTCSQGPTQMLAASKCVVEAFDSNENSNTTLWSSGGDSNSIPDIRAIKNAGVTDCGCQYTAYSIQTATSVQQISTTGECPVGDRSGSLVIPCYGNDSIPDSIAGRTTTPKVSDWVTRWILEHGKSSTAEEASGSASHGSASTTTESGKGGDSGFSLWWLLLILLLILLLTIATIVACRRCRRLSRFNAPPDNTTYIFVGGRMWAVQDESPNRGAGYWFRFVNWCMKTFNFFE